MKKKETLVGSKDYGILPIARFSRSITQREDSSSRCGPGGGHTREFYLPKWNYSPEKVRADVADGGQRRAGDRGSSRREDRHGAGPPSCASSLFLEKILGSIVTVLRSNGRENLGRVWWIHGEETQAELKEHSQVDSSLAPVLFSIKELEDRRRSREKKNSKNCEDDKKLVKKHEAGLWWLWRNVDT